MKTLRLEHRYPFPRAQVAPYFLSRAFHEAKYRAMGRDDALVLADLHEAGRFEITVRYPATADGPMPEFIKKLIGERVSLTQIDTWNTDTLRGEIQVTIKPGPGVRLWGELQLLDAGATTVLRMDWQVECRVPLIGGKVEQFLVGDLSSKATTDERGAIAALRAALEG